MSAFLALAPPESERRFMEDQHIDVVVRCRNEMPFAASALSRLREQRGRLPKIVFFDCGSTDGSREEAEKQQVRVVDVDPSTYRPGAVLNQAMKATTSSIVAFVNADAIPLSDSSLTALIAPFAGSSTVAATFGRQVARRDASADVKADYARAFAEQAVALRRGSFFSMAASAIRRRAWEAQPFDESLRYSEDVEWTTRLRRGGWTTHYASGASFEHSHDYSIPEHFRRRRGEGAADSEIFGLGPARALREWMKPLAGAVLRDAHTGVVTPRTIAVRAAQASGYFVGRMRSRP